MEGSWRQRCWDLQRRQIVYSEQSLKSLQTVAAVKACRSSNTWRNDIAIPHTSLYILHQKMWCHLADTPWVQENNRKPAPPWRCSEKDGCLWHAFKEKFSFMPHLRAQIKITLLQESGFSLGRRRTSDECHESFSCHMRMCLVPDQWLTCYLRFPSRRRSIQVQVQLQSI